MSGIPKDPFMLYSFVNTMLRDKFSSLEELCSAYDANPAEIIETLRTAGFEYDADLNQFG